MVPPCFATLQIAQFEGKENTVAQSAANRCKNKQMARRWDKKNKTKIKLARRKGGPKKEEEVRYAMLQLGCRVLVRGSYMWQRPH